MTNPANPPLEPLPSDATLLCSVCAKEKRVTEHYDVRMGFISPALFTCNRCMQRRKQQYVPAKKRQGASAKVR